MAAAIAAVLPLLTVLYSTFSVEARPYALMACALAFAAVAWQRASAPVWSLVLALTLVASVSIHYYAVFALLPFAAAELTWSVVHITRTVAPLPSGISTPEISEIRTVFFAI